MNSIIILWIREGVRLDLPATPDDISQCEQLISFKFPEDFVALYRVYNGFEEFEMDSRLLSLWSLPRIQREFDHNDEFVAICDFLIDSHRIGFLRDAEGIYKDYNRTMVCKTFSEFLDHWKNETAAYL